MQDKSSVANSIIEALKTELDLESQVEDFKDGSIGIRTNLNLNFIDYPVFMQVSCYKDNSMSVHFIFNDFEESENNLRFVNNFNKENEYVKAYISKFLVFAYTTANIKSDEDYVTHTLFALNNMLADSNVDLIKKNI